MQYSNTTEALQLLSSPFSNSIAWNHSMSVLISWGLSFKWKFQNIEESDFKDPTERILQNSFCENQKAKCLIAHLSASKA